MKIRNAIPDDIQQIRQLFYDTINVINSKDYSSTQIAIWALADDNQEYWISKIKEQYFFVADLDKKIVGFISLTDEGYIDLLYVHKNHQRKGIATSLLKKTQNLAIQLNIKTLSADVSITAKPFFERHEFKTTSVYIKKVKNIEFTNSIMAKKI